MPRLKKFPQKKRQQIYEKCDFFWYLIVWIATNFLGIRKRLWFSLNEYFTEKEIANRIVFSEIK